MLRPMTALTIDSIHSMLVKRDGICGWVCHFLLLLRLAICQHPLCYLKYSIALCIPPTNMDRATLRIVTDTSDNLDSPYTSRWPSSSSESGSDRPDSSRSDDTSKTRYTHRPTVSFSSTISTDSATSSSTSDKPERLVRAKVRNVLRTRKPALRRCATPTAESLRDLRQRQSEEDLRELYEAQTLAYLNDAIFCMRMP